MARPVQGAASTGSTSKSAPVVLAGVDNTGVVRPLAVSNTGVVSISGSTPPTGNAGGVLDGTYPNPGLAAAVAGAGLTETTNVLSVNVDGTTLEIATDTLQVKGLGIATAQVSASAAIPASKLVLTVRNAAGVPAGAPTGSELPLAYDSTAVTGGFYFWTGAAWVKVSTIL